MIYYFEIANMMSLFFLDVCIRGRILRIDYES